MRPISLESPDATTIAKYLKHGDVIEIIAYDKKITGKIFIPKGAVSLSIVWICSNENLLNRASIIDTLYKRGEKENLGYKYSWCITNNCDRDYIDITITKKNTQIIKNWGNPKLRKILMEKNII